MSERSQLNMAIDPDRKQKWHEYAEENDRNLSQLIRFSVERQITDTNESGGVASEQFAELVDALQEIDSRLDRMNDRLNDVERSISQDAPEVQELANDVFDVLPTQSELMRETHESVVPAKGGEEIGHVKTGRLDHIATRLGVEKARAAKALQKLQDDTTMIDTKSIGGQTRYFKEV